MTIEEMKRRKREKGYTFKKMAELSGVPVGTIQKIFNGETKSPRQATIQALEKILRPQENYDKYFGGSHSVKYNGNSMIREAGTLYHFESVRHFPKKTDYRIGEDGFIEGPYSYEDYLALPDEQNVELIHGIFYDMASPDFAHQMIQSELIFQFMTQFRRMDMNCDAVGPVDTRIEKNDKTIIQPDISILCHNHTKGNRIREKIIWGGADMVIEILSASTRSKDINIKTRLYRNGGVREYWMVDPRDRIVFQIIYGVKEVLHIHRLNETVEVAISEGRIKIDLNPIEKILNQN